MNHNKALIDQLSLKAKIELIVLAQNTDEIIRPLLDALMEDGQVELDVLYELGFLDLDSDEDDEENARAEFSSDVEQFLIEDIGRQHEHELIAAVFKRDDLLESIKQKTPTIADELDAVQSQFIIGDANEAPCP